MREANELRAKVEAEAAGTGAAEAELDAMRTRGGTDDTSAG